MIVCSAIAVVQHNTYGVTVSVCRVFLLRETHQTDTRETKMKKTTQKTMIYTVN